MENFGVGGVERLRDRAHGRFFTPVDIATELVRSAVTDYPVGVDRVLDLAVGEGSLLSAVQQVFAKPLILAGVEIDAEVAANCVNKLAQTVHPGSTVRIQHGDGLSPAMSEQLRHDYGRFDLVIGNPPFLSPRLRSARFGHINPVDWVQLRQWYPEVARSTTDLSSYFVARAFDHVRPGGMLGMIVPVSFLAGDGAAGVRTRLNREGTLLRVDRLPKGSFDAAVSTVCIWVQRMEVVASLGEELGPSWGSWIASAPTVDFVSNGVVNDLARCTAGFRDEFYQVVEHVVELDYRQASDIDALYRNSGVYSAHPVLTVGHLGWGEPKWGQREVRIGGHKFLRPAVPAGKLSRFKASVTAGLIPKLLVAPQKRVLAPWVDHTGASLPLTPVISVLPHSPGPQVFGRLASAIASPVASQIIEHRRAGTALSVSALKFSARDIGEVPLPRDTEAWDRAAAWWPAWGDGAIERYLDAIRQAYMVDRSAFDDLLRWWRPRV